MEAVRAPSWLLSLPSQVTGKTYALAGTDCASNMAIQGRGRMGLLRQHLSLATPRFSLRPSRQFSRDAREYMSGRIYTAEGEKASG